MLAEISLPSPSLGLSEKGRIIQNLCIFLVLLHCWQFQRTNPILLKKAKKIIDGLASLEMPWGFTDWIPCQWDGAACFSAGSRPHGAERPSLTDILFWKIKKEGKKKQSFLPEWSGWMVPACREMFGGCLVVGGGGGSCNGATSFSSRWPTTSSVLVCQRPFLHVHCSRVHHKSHFFPKNTSCLKFFPWWFSTK